MESIPRHGSELSLGRSHEFIVSSAIRGGTGVIQYRDKNACTRRMIDTARILRNLCRSHGVAFIVNDRLDVALAVDADGIHVGQDDMPHGSSASGSARERSWASP